MGNFQTKGIDLGGFVDPSPSIENIFPSTHAKKVAALKPSTEGMLDYGFRCSLQGLPVRGSIERKFGKDAEELLANWKKAYDFHGAVFVKAALFQNAFRLRSWLSSNPTVHYVLANESMNKVFWDKKATFRITPTKFYGKKVTSKICSGDFESWLKKVKLSYGVDGGTGPLPVRVRRALAAIKTYTKGNDLGVFSRDEEGKVSMDFAESKDDLNLQSTSFLDVDLNQNQLDFI